MNRKLYSTVKGGNRERATEDGYYDDRYKPRVQDTKKQRMIERQRRNKKWGTGGNEGEE